MLEKNGIIPIICNISPFESLRQFAREKLGDYVQIYLQKSLMDAQKDDVKNIYKENLNVTPIVGLDVEFESPETNELVLNVESESVDDSFDKIITYLDSRGTK